MAGDARDTLLLPFDRDQVKPPSAGGQWIFLNAQPLPGNRFAGTNGLSCEQGFRPGFLALERAGYHVKPERADVSSFDGALLLLSKNRKLNEHTLVRAWNAVKPGGVVVGAGGKKAGIQSLKKWAAGRSELAGSLSKHHAQVFWLTKDESTWPLNDITAEVDGYYLGAGMFSADGPDAGSALLAKQFDQRISGKVADLGAGWGYLSSKLLDSADNKAIDLFEADYASLEAARRNLGHGNVGLNFHWHDVVGEPIRDRFDWVVMNPPFHTDRTADTALGLRFIEAAAAILNKGGRMLMVANTHLPYERALSSHFRTVAQIAQRDGFKVIEAVR